MEVTGIHFDETKPTLIPLKDLYTWVIWQFPRPKSGGYCGAIRPSIAGHNWLPAIVQTAEDAVEVYAHIGHNFSTPDEAAKHLDDFLSKKQS